MKAYLALLIAFLCLAGPALAEELPAEDPCQIPEAVANARPGAGTEATPITVGIYLLDVMNVSDIEQTYTADFFIRVKWKDDRLAWEPGENMPESCRLDLDEVWHPRVLILNQRDLSLQRRTHVRLDPDGSMSYSDRYFGSLASRHLLNRFPMDHNRLKIELLLLEGEEAVSLNLDEEITGQGQDFSINNWYVGNGAGDVDTYVMPQTGLQFPRLTYEALAKRYVDFYFWKVMALLALIVFMSWSVFWISPVFRAAQISLSGAAMLTVITFQLALVRLLPRVSYLTKMDYFILICTVWVFLSLCESVTTSVLAGHNREDAAHRIDWWARIIFPATFIAATAWIFMS